MKLKATIASILLLAGCNHAEKKETRRLSTTEEFNLRGKCVKLGEDLREGMPPPTGTNVTMSSHYNAEKNRCYVTITETPYLDVTNTPNWYSHSYLYDGQTQKQLAGAISDGSAGAGNIKKRGFIFNNRDEQFLFGETGYNEACTYIDGLMGGEGTGDR